MIDTKSVLEFVSEFNRLCGSYPNCEIECPFNRNCPSLKTITESDIEILNNWIAENKPKHYAVVMDWADPRIDEESGTVVVGVGHNMNEAKQIYERQLAHEKEVYVGTMFDSFEESSTRFEAWEADNYPNCHVLLYIQEVPS